MKTYALAFAALAALPLAAAADVSKEDIRKLVGAGISDEVILTFIRSNGPVVKITADDVVELKQAGASDRVVSALMGSAPMPAPAPQPVERVVERPVYVPQTTYIEAAPAYYSYDRSYYYRPTTYYSSYYPRYYPSYSFSYGRSRHCGPRTSFGFGVRW